MKKINNKYPRVLIISHNPLSESQDGNGRTLSAFFKQWDSDCLAQIYLTTDIPDFAICKNFFQINDIDILKRFFFKKNIQGKQVSHSNLPEMENFKHSIRTNSTLNILRKNMCPLLILLRDIVWIIAGYKTQEIINFINSFNPEVVFFLSSNSTFSFYLTKWICQSRNIPLVMQTTDDYVSGKLTLDPFFWIQLFRVKKAYQWAVSYSSCIIAIGDKMAEEYKKRFGGNYFVAMNSVFICDPVTPPLNKITQFSYAGSTGLNRWKVLALIAESLKELSNEEGLNGELSVYSLVKPRIKELSFLNIPPFSSFKGSLNNEQLKNVRKNSDFLVHVEAFDRTNKHITRLSISTKIPEYLASGRCIFAVGPEDVASMQYLKEYDIAVTVMVDNKSSIKIALREVMLNSEIKTKYAEKGIEIARFRHNAAIIPENIFQIISSAVDNNSSNELL